jgi:N-acetylglucosamine-6-phosphate deacetylase
VIRPCSHSRDKPVQAGAVFIGLAAAFGVPLVNGITHLAHRMPGYVASAQHRNGWIGHLVAGYHVQSWVQRNTPKLAGYAQSLSMMAQRGVALT